MVDGRFVCEITDAGPGFEDPFAGHLPPRPGQRLGKGQWIARQLASRVELFCRDEGFTARLWA